MRKRDNLIANDAVWARFYRDGKTLGQICEEFQCGVYDLSPWLTAPLISAMSDAGRPALSGDANAEREGNR